MPPAAWIQAPAPTAPKLSNAAPTTTNTLSPNVTAAARTAAPATPRDECAAAASSNASATTRTTRRRPSACPEDERFQ